MALALPASAGAAEKPLIDVRSQAGDNPPPAATRALERRLGDQAVVDLDPATGTPRVLARLDGALSAPATGDPADLALAYIRANRSELGLDAADLEALRPPTSDTVDGVTTVRWRQAVDGILAVDSELRVNVDRDGRVLNAFGSPVSGLDANTTPVLSAGEAVRVVQDDAGVHRSLSRRSGGEKSVTYTDGTTAKLALYTERLAWRVSYRAGSDAVYDALVDARTGKLLRRVNQVKSAVSASVWDDHPGGGAVKTVDLEPWLSTTTRLFGPNVHVYTDAVDDGIPTGDDEVTPGAYDFVALGSCVPTPCSWTAADTTTNRRQNAVQAFYFANRFHDHLRGLGFVAGAFEGADRLSLEASDGADAGQRNNAYMYTPPDGTSPLMQLQLWGGGGFRNVNGGDDASIVYHEYTHGLSNRLITDPGDAGALNSSQAGAMGEGWSDWFAKDFIDPGDTLTDGEVHMGNYVGTGIRKQALDCTVGGTCAGTATSGPGGFTYGDYGKVAGYAEIHYDGEIWAQTLWDLRKRLTPAKTRRLVADAMRLYTPQEPSFLDARNAILMAADAPDKAAIWEVFAARGMGFYASTTGGEDVLPQEDFSPTVLPYDGRLEGVIADAETGAGIAGATVSAGGSPDLVAYANPEGHFTLALPQRTYRSVVISAPGYDRQIVPATVEGTPFELNAELRRNWAAYGTGARSAGGDGLKDQGCGSMAAIDGLPGSTWSTSAGQNSTTITLPQSVDVRAFGVDPGEGCMDDWRAAAATVRIETSPTGADGSWTVRATPTFRDADRHRVNTIAASADGVRYVRVTILSTQGASDYRDISEFGVYSLAPPVDPTPSPTPTAAPPVAPAPTPLAPAPVAPPPTAIPTVPLTPVPKAAPTARPAFTLPRTGRRALKIRARCPVACAVRAELKVDARTAKGLGATRTVAKYRKTLRAGTTTFTVNLSSKARRGLRSKVKSFKATLTVRSGSVITKRKVTVRR